MPITNEVTMPTPTTLVVDRLLPGTVERVWEYWTDPDLRKQWIASGRTEGKVGGILCFDFDHRRISKASAPDKYKEQQCASLACTITNWEPPHLLGFTWGEENNESSHVTVHLSQEDDMVRLRLVHEKLEDKSSLPGISGGWHAHIDLLEDLMAGGPARDFWPRHTELEAYYAQSMV